jgi:predicted nucleotide-binding protein (sugar kinase/HSP70/actin superfamily)
LLRGHESRALDALFLPAVTHAVVPTTGTSGCMSCPIVAASGYTALAALRRDRDTLAELGITALSTELCLADPARLDEQLYRSLAEWLQLDRETHRVALRAGLAFARAGVERRRARGARVLADATKRGRAVVVVLARPYHADPGVNHGIATALAARGVPVLGISSLPLGAAELRDLSGLMPELTNSGCAEKLWAARSVVAHPNLVAVDLSSFRCGQDASILGVLQQLLGAADKPALFVHDLDEDRPAASLSLRVETFLAALRRYEATTLRATLTAEPTTVPAPAFSMEQAAC